MKPYPAASASAPYLVAARVAGLVGICLAGFGAGFMHGGFEGVVMLGLGLLLGAGLLSVIAFAKRRRDGVRSPMRPYAYLLAIPAVLLSPAAYMAEALQASAVGVGFMLALWALIRSLVELGFGRLTRDWRPWLALAFALSWPAVAKYAPCLHTHPIRSAHATRRPSTDCTERDQKHEPMEGTPGRLHALGACR